MVAPDEEAMMDVPVEDGDESLEKDSSMEVEEEKTHEKRSTNRVKAELKGFCKGFRMT